MKLAIEMFSIVIVVTIACIVFSSYISTENQNVKARDFYNVAVNRIEDSNCDAQVIKQCKEEAGEKASPADPAPGPGNGTYDMLLQAQARHRATGSLHTSFYPSR